MEGEARAVPPRPWRPSSDKLYVQAGGGIVADSQRGAEWQETQSKARAPLRAGELAEAGLDTKLE